MPVLSGLDYTEAAISDCLAMPETTLLIVNQGVETPFRERLERIAEEYDDRVFLWSHDPPLPSLAATWNRALDFVWQTGGDKALVVNNDVRLHPRTFEGLMGCLNISENLFVSAVGVTPEQFDGAADHPLYWYDYAKYEVVAKGGPDFSCFLISRACHTKYRFDEHFTPAYCEDLDYHRRLMLGGDGQKIFSVNLPFLHFAAGTLKTIDVQKRQGIERRIASGSRAYYEKKWGGPVNAETFYQPFGEPVPEQLVKHTHPYGPTTPEIQRWVQGPRESPGTSLIPAHVDAKEQG